MLLQTYIRDCLKEAPIKVLIEHQMAMERGGVNQNRTVINDMHK